MDDDDSGLKPHPTEVTTTLLSGPGKTAPLFQNITLAIPATRERQLRTYGRIRWTTHVAVPVACIALLIAFPATFFTNATGRTRSQDDLHVFCDANGNIRVFYPMARYYWGFLDPYWDPALFLSITIGFGS